jgi:hypothetical protein
MSQLKRCNLVWLGRGEQRSHRAQSSTPTLFCVTLSIHGARKRTGDLRLRLQAEQRQILQ